MTRERTGTLGNADLVYLILNLRWVFKKLCQLRGVEEWCQKTGTARSPVTYHVIAVCCGSFHSSLYPSSTVQLDPAYTTMCLSDAPQSYQLIWPAAFTNWLSLAWKWSAFLGTHPWDSWTKAFKQHLLYFRPTSVFSQATISGKKNGSPRGLFLTTLTPPNSSLDFLRLISSEIHIKYCLFGHEWQLALSRCGPLRGFFFR